MPPELSRWGWRAFAGLPFLVGLPVSIVSCFAGISHPLVTVVGVCVLAAALTAAFTDLLWRRIPNFITYSTGFSVLVLNVITSVPGPQPGDLSTSINSLAVADLNPRAAPNELYTGGRWRKLLTSISLGDSIGGGIGCFLIMLMIYRASGGGAGDVKLAASLGAGLGIERGLSMLIWSYAIAGTLILVVVCLRSGPIYLFKALLRMLSHFLLPHWTVPPSAEQTAFLRTPVPLGPSFAAGTLIAQLGGNLLEGRLAW
jgi:Flp pilus assembly protein protease CpaA